MKLEIVSAMDSTVDVEAELVIVLVHLIAYIVLLKFLSNQKPLEAMQYFLQAFGQTMALFFVDQLKLVYVVLQALRMKMEHATDNRLLIFTAKRQDKNSVDNKDNPCKKKK
mmetsp:Transcript_23163/g.25723  ORF Transcript_23163/g.25723 Transcript_23163/m.25723 type:complete len:111 (-) Transcript_23163:31-363(-)